MNLPINCITEQIRGRGDIGGVQKCLSLFLSIFLLKLCGFIDMNLFRLFNVTVYRHSKKIDLSLASMFQDCSQTISEFFTNIIRNQVDKILLYFRGSFSKKVGNVLKDSLLFILTY